MKSPQYKLKITAPKLSLPGISLVEVLLSITIFSIAIIGLYSSMQSMNNALIIAMQRDVEATYANMLMSEVFPKHPTVETSFDKTTKQTLNLPDGQKIYWTRIVDADPLAADVKRINVYLYRNSTDTTPYRQFKREIPLEKRNYHCNYNYDPYYKDTTGEVWVRLRSDQYASTTQGSFRDGVDFGVLGTWIHTGEVGTTDNVLDAPIWTKGCHYNNLTSNPPYRIPWKFLATEDTTYTITIGLVDPWNGTSVPTDILINGSVVDSFDLTEEAGGINLPLVKSYTAQSVVESGVAVLRMEVQHNSNDKAIIMNFQIERHGGD